MVRLLVLLGGVEVMNLEMEALNRNGTWIITDLFVGKKPIGSKWVFKVKYKSSGEVERFKPDWLLKAIIRNRKHLRKEKLTSVLIENDFVQNKNDFSLFTKNKNGVFIALLVYVDDIVVSGNNIDEINIVKQFLSSNFVIKDLGKLKYFLGIEVLESNDNLYLTQRKYCLEVLAEFSVLACRPCGTPIETKESISKPKKVFVDSPLSDINNYQKLVGKLIYLTHTRLDIKYVVHVLSQYMHAPLQSHLKLAFRVLSLVSWKSKNQSMLAKSSVEAEYKEMNIVTCDVIWIQKILSELKIRISLPVPIDRDNSSAIHIAANLVFYEKTKHFGIELFFLREKVCSRHRAKDQPKGRDRLGSTEEQRIRNHRLSEEHEVHQ
ncbi:uncharacterized mitochondrial protein-like protein [Tanacetum coccineum]|uniref:Uncharacterized mitochondrial protein-like protein n=1 Tax=Tanacetum coccineum TaxID=301880 RepID=A0ABQ5FCH6_9ASTR